MRRGIRSIASTWVALCVWGCGDSSSTIAVGTLERDRIDLVAEASEPVVERAVAEGDHVEAGALLVRLDPTSHDARVAEADSARARTAARLAELVRGPRRQEIDEARARLHGAEGRLATARSELARADELVSQKVMSSEQRDARRADFDEAKAARDAGVASLDALLEGTTAEEIAQAEAALAEADAALVDARLRRARLEVRAPTAGWVDALPYERGERPPAGGVVCVLLAEEAPYARVYVPAEIRIGVRPGTAATIRIDGIDAPLRGRVRHVAREASFTPYFALTERDRGRLVYLAKVDLLDSAARGLPTGVPVEVTFDLAAPIHETPDVRVGR
jgi:HlyD family secretion protein